MFTQVVRGVQGSDMSNSSSKQDAGPELVPIKSAQRHREEEPVLQTTWPMGGPRAHECISILPFISFV